MRVFVIGGTGHLGRHLLPRLLEQGHAPAVLTRSRVKAADLEDHGIAAVVGDLLRPEAWMPELAPCDAVVSVAMPEIHPRRMSRERFSRLQRQTVGYFSTSVLVAQRLGCPLILTLGTSFRTTGNQVADETWPIERFGIARIGELVDPLISEVIKRGSPPLIQMLPGEIYGPGGLFKRLMYQWMKEGRYRVIGSGTNCIPRIHVEDCAQAYVLALHKMPLGERFILADDEACSEREFANFMADCMGVPRPGSIPAFLVRLAMGRLLSETVTMNCRVSNAKARQTLDWKLAYPTYREGLPAAIKAIASDEQRLAT